MIIIKLFIRFAKFKNTIFIIFAKSFFNVPPYIPFITKKMSIRLIN